MGVLPLALLAFVVLYQNARDQQLRLLDASEDTMRAIITAVDAESLQALAAIDALATSRRLAAGDVNGFHDAAVQLLGRRPSLANVILSTPEGRQLVNARAPRGSALPAGAETDALAEVVRTRQPGISNMFFSPVLKTAAFGVRVPVVLGGTVNVLTGVVDPHFILDVLRRQRIPNQGVVGIFDRNNHVVARSLNHEQWVGQQASAGLVQLLKTGTPSGSGRTVTLEGRAVYTVFVRSETSGWTAAIGIPTEVFDAPVRRSYTVLTGAILLSLVLGLAAALLVARTITTPMHQLVLGARTLARGEAPALPATGLREVQEIGRAMEAAHEERETLLTKERDARAQAEQARRLAEEANRAKDEFLAMLGHELRNPLGAISNASQLLSMDTAPRSALAVSASAVIGRQVAHLRRLTDDLLDAARVMMGKIALERVPLDLAQSVDHSLTALRSSGYLQRHQIETALDPVWIDADAARVDQIVTNLLTNAVKYTPDGGRITVTVGREGADSVLRVRDTGIGLDADLATRVFDLFVQGTRSLDRSQGGLGIGLTLVRRLAELHNGRVEVASNGEGHGSEFVVRFPGIAAPVPEAVGALARGTASLSVAVVEDNDDVRFTLKSMLELDGHRVSEASDGHAAVDLVVRTSPDVALIDIGLPGLDGFTVAERVRAAITPPPHLVAITGYGTPHAKARGVVAGFDAYLIKPVDLAQLRALLRTLNV